MLGAAELGQRRDPPGPATLRRDDFALRLQARPTARSRISSWATLIDDFSARSAEGGDPNDPIAHRAPPAALASATSIWPCVSSRLRGLRFDEWRFVEAANEPSAYPGVCFDGLPASLGRSPAQLFKCATLALTDAGRRDALMTRGRRPGWLRDDLWARRSSPRRRKSMVPALTSALTARISATTWDAIYLAGEGRMGSVSPSALADTMQYGLSTLDQNFRRSALRARRWRDFYHFSLRVWRSKYRQCRRVFDAQRRLRGCVFVMWAASRMRISTFFDAFRSASDDGHYRLRRAAPDDPRANAATTSPVTVSSSPAPRPHRISRSSRGRPHASCSPAYAGHGPAWDGAPT